MRTYTRQQMDEARALWEEGGFSDEWREVRHTAAMRCGIVYPPTGSALDSWDDPEPSQRAILIRAIRNTPRLLDRAMRPTCRNWGDIVTGLLSGLDEMRADRREVRGDSEAPTHRESVMALGSILERIDASR